MVQHHVLIVTSIAQRQGSGLQAMGVAIDGKTTVIALQQLEVRDHAIRQGRGELHELNGNVIPLLLGTILHAFEGGMITHY